MAKAQPDVQYKKLLLKEISSSLIPWVKSECKMSLCPQNQMAVGTPHVYLKSSSAKRKGYSPVIKPESYCEVGAEQILTCPLSRQDISLRMCPGVAQRRLKRLTSLSSTS
ncbi:hypothetical protein CEXT_794351 [Caerostris extrusa]|uniref:Uncharacterized protein n=1 Tax=Caerostris extrusa TaxID=172846 RepID=A0AAV4Y4D4_CAEEX|nr:hypothetical protein CEXT_794351 [Caerostris extrusa]